MLESVRIMEKEDLKAKWKRYEKNGSLGISILINV